jgi:predicted dehydrogenase
MSLMVQQERNMNSDIPKSERRINVAVIGLGFMGVTHLRAYSRIEGVRIAAVCDPTKRPVNGKIEGIIGNITKPEDVLLDPDVKVFQTLKETLEEPGIELIDLCTPTSLHAEQAIHSLIAGKHVISEKPLAKSSESARAVLKVAESTNRFLMPAMCMRFWPGWNQLKNIVTDKLYGQVLSARFYRNSPKPFWSKGKTYASGKDIGGALFDLHIHDTDFVHFLFSTPESIFSSGVIRNDGSVDHVVTQYLYPSGPIVHTEGGWLSSADFNMGFNIYCENATLDFDLARGNEAMRICIRGQSPIHVKLGSTDGYVEELRYFVECIRSDRPPSTVTAKDAVSVLELCEAEERSLKNHRLERLQ